MTTTLKNFLKRLSYSFIFLFAFSLIGTLVSSLTVEKNSINLMADYVETLSKYDDCDYDFVVRGLSKEQIKQINGLGSVKETVCYHNTNATIKINNEETDISIFSLTDDNKVNLTEFSEKRLINKSNESNENSIYLYEQFSKTYGYDIGDFIKIAGIKFKVTRIYRDNFDKVVYIPNFETILREKFSQDLSVSGIYVSCINKDDFRASFLNSYKPLASLKTRDEFDTQEQYDNYLSEFNSKDYSSYYKDKMENYDIDLEKANKYLNNSTSNSVLSGVIIGSFILLGTILMLLINYKKIKVEIVSNGRKEIIKRNGIVFCLVTIATFIATTISLLILCNHANSFIRFASAFTNVFYEWIFVVIFTLFGFLLSFIITNKKRESIKNEN